MGNNTRENRNRLGMSIVLSMELWKLFKDMVAREGLSTARVVEQFMSNYVDYLDSSFIQGHVSRKRRRKSAHAFFTVSDDIYAAFRRKTRKERLSVSAVIEQFIKNYVDFTSRIHGARADENILNSLS